MTKTCTIHHPASQTTLVPTARWCDTFATRLRGFMFQKTLQPEEGLVIDQSKDSRSLTAIHMFFVNFDLGVLWVNSDNVVVDKVVAKAWKPNYTPQAPARYVIEMHPRKLAAVAIGDTIDFQF